MFDYVTYVDNLACLSFNCRASYLINGTREYEPHLCSQTIRDSFEY